MSGFVHLHCHTEFSLLEGAVRIKDMLAACTEQQMSSIALTDNGTLYGAIDFYLKAKALGINPIIGCEFYLTPDISVKERGLDRLILLATSYKGYQQLIKLVSIAHLDGFYYKPRIDLAHLERYSEDLIAISPGYRGPVAWHIQGNRFQQAHDMARRLKDIYSDNFYLGVQRLGLPMEDIVIQGICEFSKTHSIPIVATNDVYYMKEEESVLKEILTCIQMGKQLDNEGAQRFRSQSAYFRSVDDMRALFSDMPEALENTLKIAEKCHIEIETEQVRLPQFKCPNNMDSAAYLEELVWAGVKEKYGEITPELTQRVEYELGIINKMYYAIYFLIIYDFLDYCTRSDIPVGPGRGSAAGSVVAYALNITRIDPIKYNLLFERFLNPERVSMPDIDLDFCIRRRSEVIDYIVERYGADNVSQIVTFGTMAARAVIRDVGRVLNIPLSDVDRIAKLIPSLPGKYTSIPEALEQIDDLKKVYESESQVKQLIDYAIKLEGFSRHTSTHAAGVVISRDPLTTIVPLAKNEGQIVTQYAMSDIEKVGLLKMDILGLRNLTVMKETQRLVKESYQLELDLDDLDMLDAKTYQLFCAGQTVGVFQLESSGMRALIKDLKPDVFEDIIALLALYRPGPLGSGMVQTFISNKSGDTQVKYDLPELEPILKETYGMILYQEQVMQIASVVGGFSLGQADMLRRAMGKKKKAVMDVMRSDFMDGAKEKQFDLKVSDHIFELCYKFAEYGFNKSHSAAYALISFQTAYLKANYPVEYMASLLSSVLGNSDKAALYVQECKDMGISILPPSVQSSKLDFTVQEGAIRFGLGAIKNVGEGAIESIVMNQQEDGPYKDLTDFCMRVDLKQANKRVIESLIKSGAFDSLGDRSELLSVYEKCLESAQVLAKEQSKGQIGLFCSDSLIQATPEQVSHDDYVVLTPIQKLFLEKEMLGLFISGHPLDSVKDKLIAPPISSLSSKDANKIMVINGILVDTRRVITKTNKEMVIGRLEDLGGTVTVMMFQNDKTDHLWEHFNDDNIVVVKGRVRFNQDEISMIVDDITPINVGTQQNLHISLHNIDKSGVYHKIRSLCQSKSGAVPLYFHVENELVLAHKRFWVEPDDGFLKELTQTVGSGHYWFS